MKGVSEVIAIILILMITISLAGLAYMFMSTTMSDVTASAGSTVDTTTTSMLTSFKIESIDIAKIYVRNMGQNALTGLSVYVDDEPATYNITPTSITAGQVGTITVYSFIPDGATVKVTSPSGFSTSKVADECSKAVACWKFDEGVGNVTYDSSPYGNMGTLVNGPTWTSGKYGNALIFDGVNDKITFPNSSAIQNFNAMTFLMWVKTANVNTSGLEPVSFGYWTAPYGFLDQMIYPGGVQYHNFYLRNTAGSSSSSSVLSNYNTWELVGFTWNGTHWWVMQDGVLSNMQSFSGTVACSATHPVIGSRYSSTYFYNGIIDEVRIYNRAIY